MNGIHRWVYCVCGVRDTTRVKRIKFQQKMRKKNKEKLEMNSAEKTESDTTIDTYLWLWTTFFILFSAAFPFASTTNNVAKVYGKKKELNENESRTITLTARLTIFVWAIVRFSSISFILFNFFPPENGLFSFFPIIFAFSMHLIHLIVFHCIQFIGNVIWRCEFQYLYCVLCGMCIFIIFWIFLKLKYRVIAVQQQQKYNRSIQS